MRTFRDISGVAAGQHGVVRTQQTGLDSAALNRAVRAGALYRKYRGVYAVGHPHLSREGEWLAAVFAAGDGAALASFSAAVLWEITRFKETEIIVVSPRRHRPQPGFRVITRRLDPRDVLTHNGIPVTTVARTLIDLADHLAPDQLAFVIHEAARRHRFSLEATRAAMARSTSRKLHVLDAAIRLYRDGSAGTRSELERRFRKLATAAGLPEPATNTHVHSIEVDAHWPGLCVEIDGPHHLQPRTKTDDRIRDAVLHAHGETVIRFTEHDVDHHPTTVIEALRQASSSNSCS
jgi:hypothetical protein